MRTLLVFTVILAASGRAEDWSKRFDVAGQPELRIQAGDAAVTLRAGAAGAVSARLTSQGRAIGTDEVRVHTRQDGNRIEMEVRAAGNPWGFGSRSVSLEVLVPEELRAEIHTDDGRVSAQGLKGEFRFVTGDGAIEAESLDGALSARSGDGSVRVRGRFDQIDLRTNDGSIEASFDRGSKMAGPWRVETGDGNVTIRLPEGFAADLDAHTGGGGISVSLPVTTTGFHNGDHNFRGKLNGGGLPLRIRTGDGSIRLERL
jgi:hypothetical protein